ncbi:MAG: hypothetical protein AABX72_01160 [Nanoarchaeota archaeon]
MPDLPFARTNDGLLRISKGSILFVDSLLHRNLQSDVDLEYHLTGIRNENPSLVDFITKKIEGTSDEERTAFLEGFVCTYEMFRHQQRANNFVEEFTEMFTY